MSQCLQVTLSGTRCKNRAIDLSGYCRKHHPSPAERSSTGDEFENLVAAALRVLGYRVERDVTVNGCQVDLYAEYRTGIIPIKLMIECKDYRSGEKVGNDEMRLFAATLSSTRPSGIDKGLFVTTHGFTRDAKEYAKSQGIELATYTELTTQLVDFDEYVHQITVTFDNMPAAQYYVDLSGSEREDYDQQDSTTLTRPLDKLVDKVLFEENRQAVALLGNFGTGKTTFCHKYAHDLAKRFKKDDPNSRVPVVVSLGEFGSSLNIQQLITNTLQFTYKMRGLDPALCMRLQELGRLVLLFDGFDEMANKADPYIIRENMRELSRVLQVADNKIIVTCRTHFFRDEVQAQVLTSFRRIYVPEWGEPEISEYLQKRFGPTWREELKKINGTHDLSDLAQTPLFLDMITATLPKLGSEVNRYGLYEEYTTEWIRQQSGRRGARLDALEREHLVHQLAVRLFVEGRQSCHYRELTPILLAQFADHDSVDALQADVRTCTFLTRNTEGEYRFKHKSFMEFFVAKAIVTETHGGHCDLLGVRPLPPEIRGFVTEAPGVQLLIPHLVQWLEDERTTLRDNVVALVADLNVDVDSLQGADRTLILVARFRQGDIRALNILMRDRWESLREFASTLLSQHGITDISTDELVTEAALLAPEQRERLLNAAGLLAFLQSTVLQAVDSLRIAKRSLREDILDNSLGSSSESVSHEQSYLFALLCQEYRDQLSVTARRLIRSYQLANVIEADELVVDVILRASMRGIRLDANPLAYLRIALLHRLKDISKNQAQERRYIASDVTPDDLSQNEGEPASEGDLVLDAIVRNELAEELKAAISSLPSAQRIVVVDRFYNGHSLKHIAERLGIRPEVVRHQLARALATLRRFLTQSGYEP